MPLSRRRFLQSLGITLAASSAGLSPHQLFAQAGQNRFMSVQGRALYTAMVRSRPEPTAPVVRSIWEDEIVDLRSISGRWFRTSDGYVAFEDAQPMHAAPSSVLDVTPPFWSEVRGAVAVVRAWCSADAPLVTRIGHGGVMRVIDQLVTPEGGWYALAEENGQRIGWSRSAVWLPVEWQEQPRTLNLIVNRSGYRAEVRNGEEALVEAEVAFGKPLRPGTYSITDATPSKTQIQEPPRYGIPWALTSGNDLSLSGVYWHNRFGDFIGGDDLQLPVILAREIYPRLDRVIIV